MTAPKYRPAIAFEPVALRPSRAFGKPFSHGGPPTALQPPRPPAYEDRPGVALADLEPAMCRWPVGKPGAGLFCGCATTSRYCEDHAQASRLRVVDPGEVEKFVAMGLRIANAAGARR